MRLYEMTKDQLAAKTRACFDKFDSDHSGVCVCVCVCRGREGERACVCLCVRERPRSRESGFRV
jgi:hypothetical protein